MLPEYTAREWASRVVGKSNRIVCKIDDTSVVKFGCPSSVRTGQQNIDEWNTWQMLKDSAGAHLFCPTIEASEDGSWNIQDMADGSVSSDMVTDEHVTTPKNLGIGDLGWDGGTHQMGVHYLTGAAVIRDYGIPSEGIDWSEWHSSRKGECGECLFCQIQKIRGDYDYAEDDDPCDCGDCDDCYENDPRCRTCSDGHDDADYCTCTRHSRERSAASDARWERLQRHAPEFRTFDHPNSCTSRVRADRNDPIVPGLYTQKMAGQLSMGLMFVFTCRDCGRNDVPKNEARWIAYNPDTCVCPDCL